MEFVLLIILITTIGGVLKARYGVVDDKSKRVRRRSRGRMGFLDDRSDDDDTASDTFETARLKDEVRSLKDRIATLERITVEKESSLSREIDSLRDR